MKKIIIVISMSFALLVPSIIQASENAQAIGKPATGAPTVASILASSAPAKATPSVTPEKSLSDARKERLAKLAEMNGKVGSPSNTSVPPASPATAAKPAAATDLAAARKARIAELARNNTLDPAEVPSVAKGPGQETEKIKRDDAAARAEEAKAAEAHRKIVEQAAKITKELQEKGAATLELAVEKAFGKNEAAYTAEQKAAINLIKQELEATSTLFAILGSGVSAGLVPFDGWLYLFNLAKKKQAKDSAPVIVSGMVVIYIITALILKANRWIAEYPALAPYIYTLVMLVIVRYIAIANGAMPATRAVRYVAIPEVPAAADTNTNSGADRTGKEEKGVQDKDKKDK